MHIAERKRLYEEAHPETKKGATLNKGNVPYRKVCDTETERFTADTAKKTRTSERKVQMEASRGEKIESLAKVVRTSLDKGEELDALTKLKSNCLPTVS